MEEVQEAALGGKERGGSMADGRAILVASIFVSVSAARRIVPASESNAGDKASPSTAGAAGGAGTIGSEACGAGSVFATSRSARPNSFIVG